MTKKHFIALANAIRHHNKYGPPMAAFNIHHIQTLADFCGSQNPAFNRDRWQRYIRGECGPNGGAK